MIVITSLMEAPRAVYAGDVFTLRLTDKLGSEIVVTEEITANKVIDFIASYRFAHEDGTVIGFHLSGAFACRSELPKELAEAVLIEDLSRQQYENFVRTAGVKRPGDESARMFAKFHEQERTA